MSRATCEPLVMGRRQSRNMTGGTYHLTVVTPVQAGAEVDLRRVLETLPQGAASPLAGPGTAHFGRWVLIPDPLNPSGPQTAWWLLFAAVVDGQPGTFLTLLVVNAGPTVEAIWRHCVGWPGAEDPTGVVAWLEDHAIDNTLCFATWAGPTVEGIRTALARRDQVTAMALETQGLPAPALLQAFRRRFG